MLRRIWRYQMHMSIHVKCYAWIQLASSFRFDARFLYVIGLFSSATHLMASYPYYKIALMTSHTLYNKKYSIFLKMSSRRSSLFHNTLNGWHCKTQIYSNFTKFCNSGRWDLIDWFIMGRIFLCTKKKWVGWNIRWESNWVGYFSKWVGYYAISDRYFKPWD